MDLQAYTEKRNFSKTPEPAAGSSSKSDQLVFVVQKHAASHLHYDFRLELDGVLKSWAIPKGPSTDPKVKHLAVMVEDHPFDYRTFEGNIPKGEYGGGTVIVWDEGTYEPIERIEGKDAQEKYLLKQLGSGQLKINLHGQKLIGEFALVKTHGMGENGWLMIKHQDEFASSQDITLQDRSVLSGMDLEEMAGNKPQVNLLPAGHDPVTITLDGRRQQLTHLDKILWPGEHITKRDMLNYYLHAAEFILPYLKDRPMSLNRFPDGINGPHFYQKDITGKAPDGTPTYAHTTAKGENHHYLVGGDISGLLWMAGQGCIEINPWLSRVGSPACPDHCVIDLDPEETNTFAQVIVVAKAVKEITDALHIPAFLKTSGSTGMHIYIPIGNSYSFDQSQQLAKLIVSLVNTELPKSTTLERKTTARNGRIYLDFLQNRPEATIAGVYSLRPKPGATVSMPLHWDELKGGLKMRDFNIFNAINRIRETGDLFKGVLGPAIDLPETLLNVQRLLTAKRVDQ